MKYTVFYRNQLEHSYEVPKEIGFNEYEQVAKLEAANLEEVFRRMNVVSGDPAIEIPVTLGIRSLSVGDVVMDEKGAIHYCAMIGWRTITIYCNVDVDGCNSGWNVETDDHDQCPACHKSMMMSMADAKASYHERPRNSEQDALDLIDAGRGHLVPDHLANMADLERMRRKDER